MRAKASKLALVTKFDFFPLLLSGLTWGETVQDKMKEKMEEGRLSEYCAWLGHEKLRGCGSESEIEFSEWRSSRWSTSNFAKNRWCQSVGCWQSIEYDYNIETNHLPARTPPILVQLNIILHIDSKKRTLITETKIMSRAVVLTRNNFFSLKLGSWLIEEWENVAKIDEMPRKLRFWAESLAVFRTGERYISILQNPRNSFWKPQN